jgi:hypothetical protein
MNYPKKSSIWNKVPGLLDALFDCIARKLSARQAAEELSAIAGQRMNRNALIGKARRNGATFLGTDPNHRKTPRYPKSPKVRYRPMAPPNLDLPAERPISKTFLCITFENLEPGQCRFPHGDDPLTMTYCGQPAVNEGAWCDYHRSICTVRGSTQWRPESSSIFKMTV